MSGLIEFRRYAPPSHRYFGYFDWVSTAPVDTKEYWSEIAVVNATLFRAGNIGAMDIACTAGIIQDLARVLAKHRLRRTGA